MTFLYFLSGFLVGALVIWMLYLAARRRMVLIDEKMQMLFQEKQIVVDFMHNLVEGIGEGIDRKELFKKIVHAAILSTGAISASVFDRQESGKLSRVATEGLFPPLKPVSHEITDPTLTRAKKIERIFRLEEYDVNEGLIGGVAQTGEGLLIKDASHDPRIHQNHDEALAVKSIIVAPILFKKEVLGVLAVANPLDGTAFNEADFSLVQSLGEQAGMAIHNSDNMNIQIEKNKLDIDLTLASNIQGMLLPHKFPNNEKLDIDALYQPAQKVGGDLYDVFSLDEGKVGIAIADVSGKGIPASLLMAICQTNLRHYAQSIASPAKVLQAVNRQMEKHMRKDMFITVAYAIIDTNKNQIILSRAGHELPLVLHHNPSGESTIKTVGSEGMALGMVPSEIFDATISEITIPFEPGDLFIFYTDGITEASNESGLEFSTDRLSQAIEDFSNQSADKLNHGIINRVQKFASESGITDDLTLVTVKHI